MKSLLLIRYSIIEKVSICNGLDYFILQFSLRLFWTGDEKQKGFRFHNNYRERIVQIREYDEKLRKYIK